MHFTISEKHPRCPVFFIRDVRFFHPRCPVSVFLTHSEFGCFCPFFSNFLAFLNKSVDNFLQSSGRKLSQKTPQFAPMWITFLARGNGSLRLSGVGQIRARGQARQGGEIRAFDILHRDGRWYLSLTVALANPERPRQSNDALAFDPVRDKPAVQGGEKDSADGVAVLGGSVWCLLLLDVLIDRVAACGEDVSRTKPARGPNKRCLGEAGTRRGSLFRR